MIAISLVVTFHFTYISFFIILSFSPSREYNFVSFLNDIVNRFGFVVSIFAIVFLFIFIVSLVAFSVSLFVISFVGIIIDRVSNDETVGILSNYRRDSRNGRHGRDSKVSIVIVTDKVKSFFIIKVVNFFDILIRFSHELNIEVFHYFFDSFPESFYFFIFGIVLVIIIFVLLLSFVFVIKDDCGVG